MKNTVKRRLLGLAGTFVLAGGALVATAGPAQAASPCPGTFLHNYQITGGYMSVYYSSATGQNCSLTYTNNPGVAQHIYAGIGLWRGGDQHADVDSNTYKYYAGPVFVSAPGQCIWVEGAIGANSHEAVGPIFCN